MKKKILYVLLALLGLVGLYASWQKWVRPTRIALVNYSDFQTARFVQSNTSRFVDIETVLLNDTASADLSDYDLVLSWSHGVPFTENVRDGLRSALKAGVAVYCVGATSAENDLTSMDEADVQALESYLENGGSENYGRMYNYVRARIHKAKLFVDAIQVAKVIPSDVFFHLGETYFGSYTEYRKYRVEKGLEKPGAPRVALFTSNLGPRNAGRTDIDQLITALEDQGLNVYPIDGFFQRLEMLDSVKPQLVLSMPHGRFLPGQEQAAVAYFQKNNIPLLAPIKVFRDYEDWMKDQRGMDGGVLGQSVVVPELDGAIESFVTAAQFKSEQGYSDFKAIDGRPERLARRVANWIHLQKTKNAEKKVSIVYLKGPGQNALVAGGLEVLPSLYALLLDLRAQGYKVDNLPESVEEFDKLVHRQGMVPGPYAGGTIAKIIQDGNPARIPVATYEKWAKEALAPESWELVQKTYGSAPGPYMSISSEDSAAILVNRIEFGNVAILPQPLPGYGDNEFTLVHGVQVPPPHPYIAAYLWAAKGFHSDALIHFGTHGSFEFLPAKQVALSLQDWPDALIGDMPHGYVYIINNIGEAMMAKRRGYAVMLSHLTPPFMASDLYADLQQLHDKLHHYLLPNLDAATKSQYAATLKELVLRLHLDKDLEIQNLKDRELGQDEIDRIHNHVHAIEQEKVGQGLYVLGRPYNDKQAAETARLMHVDAVAFSLAELDVAHGKADRKVFDNKHLFGQKYRTVADHLITDALQGKDVLAQVVTPPDLARLAKADSLHNATRSLRRAMVRNVDNVDTAQIASLLAELASDTAKVRFIRSWASNREYQRVASLLDPVARARFDKAAGFIPEMKRIADLMDAPGMTSLIRAASSAESRKALLALLDKPATRAAIAQKMAENRKAWAIELQSEPYRRLLVQLGDSLVWNQMLQASDSVLAELDRRTAFVQAHGDLLVGNAKNMLTVLSQRRNVLGEEMARRANWEESYLLSLQALRSALLAVKQSEKDLVASTSLELAAVRNMLAGGYIAPSPGGDPVSNPQAVPTGRNLYAINAENTPTRESWEIAKRMVDALLQREIAKQGRVPRKVALTLWGGEFVRDQGVTIAQALYLMGVEPVWNSRGRMHDVKLIAAQDLGRPRVDVVVQTSGQFRDMGASRLYLINKAVRLVSEAPDEENGFANFVRQGSGEAEAELLKSGKVSPARAAKIARIRTFGGVNGNYGTGIMGLVESGDKWENEKQIQNRYIQNMGAFYDEDEWSTFEQGAFTAALRHTEVVLQSRSSNTTGPISLDHTYEFMGGLVSAVRGVTGKDPRTFFTDTRNRLNPVVQDAKEAVWVEARSTVLNPKYVQEMTKEGESAAEMFAEAFRNTYGWDVMKPTLIDEELWDEYYKMYVEDQHKTGVREFFEQKNPFAYQEMTAVMLETIRKGYWNPDAAKVQKLAQEHARAVSKHGAGCSGFVCDNPKLKAFIGQKLDKSQKDSYEKSLQNALSAGNAKPALQMKKQQDSVALPPVQSGKLALIFLLIVGGLSGVAFLILRRGRK